ncbi:ABC transporter permease [bacterium]|nr:ABC transporter permease [bacterium]
MKRFEYAFALVVILLIWQAGAMLTSGSIIASPLIVFHKLIDEALSGNIGIHIGRSIFRILAALVLAFVSAVPFGLYLGLSKRADRIAKPFIYLSYPIPKIILMPVVMLIFGLGDLSKIVLLWMILFFQLLITTRDAARIVSKEARFSLLSLGGTKWHLFRHVIWPSCLPSVLTALRITTGTMVAVLFLVESIGTRQGLGYYIIDAWGRADIPQIFVGMVLLAAIGVLFYELFDLLEKRYCKWNQI